jgi:D-3-phosphoglycerate dehydrogenase
MGKPVIGITDYVAPPYDIEFEGSSGACSFVNLAKFPNSEGSHKGLDFDLVKSCDGLLVWHTHIDRPFTKFLDNAKIVVRYGVGYDNIDVSALAERGIRFCNNPAYGTEEVADTACSMILSIARGLVHYDEKAREISNGWQENVCHHLKRMSSMTVGIVGTGRIGTAVINRMSRFGISIVGFDPLAPSGYEKAVGFERVNTLAELLGRADIVSLHLPLDDFSRGLVDADFISSMKRGASLVNTARGELIESLDVVGFALKQNHLQSVFLDVLPEEPPKFDHWLMRAWKTRESWVNGRFLINPHTAYYSREAWREMRYEAARTAKMYLTDGRIRNEITG